MGGIKSYEYHEYEGRNVVAINAGQATRVIIQNPGTFMQPSKG